MEADVRQPCPVDCASPRRRRTWSSSRSAGWLEDLRAQKTPDEVERIAAACAVADRALAALLPEIRPGVTEHDLALRLEWLMRTGGAEALAFDVACLAGPEAALPHGSPGDRPVLDGEVLLFDFGAQVEGYRSDMTRTLFVGEPRERDLAIYELVARAQQACIDALQASVTRNARPGRLADRRPDGRRGGAGRDRGGRPRRRTSGTGRGTGSASRRTRSRGCPTPPPTTRCPAPRCSAWSPACTSRARPASGSRTSSTST